jgi:hypothetical protein
METEVAQGQDRTESLVKEAHSDIDTLNKKRKQDRAGFELEIKQLKKRLGGVFDNSDTVLKGMDHMFCVLNVLLEGERVQNALDVQDTIDRKRIALMGCKDDDTTLVRSHQMTPQVPRAEHRHPTDGYQHPNQTSPPRNKKGPQVINVDTRCLSCSGQAPTVMTAFKMACLQYTPSQILYHGKEYDRQELLHHRETLVKKAHEELAKGRRSQEKGGDGEGGDEPSSPVSGSPSDDGLASPSMFALNEYATAAPWTHRSKNDKKLPNLTKSSNRTLIAPSRLPLSGTSATSPRKSVDVH